MTSFWRTVLCAMSTTGLLGIGASVWVGCHGSTESAADCVDATCDDVTPDESCAATVSEDVIASDCHAYADARCALETRCIDDPVIREPSCASVEQAHCSARLSLPGADAASVERCTAALGSLTCDDYLTAKLPADCFAPPGPFAIGQPCTDDSQCASASCSALPPGVQNGPAPSGCGTCLASSDAGGQCPCEPGLVCGVIDRFSSSGYALVCGTPRVAGQSCDDSSFCVRGLNCVGDGGFVCTLPSGDGGPCDDVSSDTYFPQPCSSQFTCVAGRCAPNSNDCSAQCAPQACTRNFGGGVICYTPGAEGEPCGGDRTSGYKGCADGLVCSTPCGAPATCSGTCEKPPPPPTPASCAQQMGLPVPSCKRP